MASQWDEYKDEIIDLYLIQDKSLSQVIEEIANRHGFHRGDRSYREKLAKWGALKTPLKFRDSGYASNRASAATTPSRPVSTDDVEMGEGPPCPTSQPMQEVAPHAPSSDAASLHTEESDGSNTTLRNQPLIEEQGQAHDDQQRCVLTEGRDVLPTSHPNLCKTAHELNTPAHQLPVKLKLKPPPSQPSLVTLSSIHAPISRCPFAREDQRHINIAIELCEGCGASKAHHLAMLANWIDKPALFEKLHNDLSESEMNHVEADRNTPLHFLASSGPRSDRIQCFARAGANLLSRNLNGDTFLHALEASRLKGQHLLELLMWCVKKGCDLMQRNHDGKTTLHCLIDRKLGQEGLFNVLTVLKSAPRRSTIHNTTQSPLAEYLLARDNRGRTIFEIIKTDAPYLQPVIDYLLPNSEFPLIATTLPINVFSSKNHRPRTLTRVTTEELQEKDKVMRSTVSLSVSDPSTTNPGDGMNAVSCLAHIVRLCPEYEMDLQPLFARETHLKQCIDYGADPNHYDCTGSPPLHHFVSTRRSNESEERTADLLALLIYHGADVNLRNSKGESVLHVACQLGRVACVKKLITYRANVRALDYRYNGIIVSAKRWMDGNPENDALIQECISLVSRAENIQSS